MFVADSLNKDIARVQEKLRELDSTIATLRTSRRDFDGGVSGIKRRISQEGFGSDRFSNGRRRLISTLDEAEFCKQVCSTCAKALYTAVEGCLTKGLDCVRHSGYVRCNFFVSVTPVLCGDCLYGSRTLASTVVMPSIETKSREEKIEEMNKTEKKEVTTRNRRMFSNLLMGTLTRFQRDEKKIQNVEKIQAEKQMEVEKRLEDKRREDREKMMAERQKLFDERREQERELRSLQRKKALMQYPTIFFAPAKHSMRSLELLKASEKAIDGLMELRQKELERELENGVDDERDQEQNVSEVQDQEPSDSKEIDTNRRHRDRSFSNSGDENDHEKSPELAELREKSAEHEGVTENNNDDDAIGEEESIQPDEESIEKEDD
uniref:Pinin_SDK_memA domain-containing protein n=1 Tax=Angiostrongylus cantonensis TaxID=6313 RepID=A0A0K0DF75_ANGCA